MGCMNHAFMMTSHLGLQMTLHNDGSRSPACFDRDLHLQVPDPALVLTRPLQWQEVLVLFCTCFCTAEQPGHHR